MTYTFTVEQSSSGQRLDKLISEYLDEVSRTAAAQLAESGSVTVNGKAVGKKFKVSEGDEITVDVPEPVELKAEAEDIPLDIVYEDDDLLVVNKPKGMVVHPAPGNYSGTLVNALLFHCKGSLSGINGVLRPGIVHRIDKDTSGLLIVAKSDRAHTGLAQQIKEHSFTREYEAVAYGKFKQSEGTVDAPIGRSQVDRKKMCVTDHCSKKAVTHYRVIDSNNGFSHVALKLETGRTHQIRVHLAYIGHPVAGDPVYGPSKVITELHGQCLHAKKIGFTHPVTGEFLSFDSELPDYFSRFLSKNEIL